MYGTRIARKHNALIFDGIDDYVEIPHNPSLNPLDALTIEFWMKGGSKDGYQALVQKKPWDGYVTRYDSIAEAVEFFLRFNDETTASFWTGGVPVGEWRHIAFTFDKNLPSNNMKCYVNGVMNFYDAGAGKLLKSTTEPLMIGRGVDVYYLGTIDKLRIYNRALTATEISKLYKGQYIANGLVLHLDFNELGGNKCLDLSGYKNDGTIHGARRSILRTGGLSFDGDNYVETTKGVYENGGTFTFMAWILFKSFPQTWNAIFGQRNFPRLQYWTVDKSLKFNIWVDGADVEFSSLSFEALGVWKHITVIVYPKDNVDFYIDGEFLNRATNVGRITHTDPATNPITLATPTVPGVNWPSVILDEIRIYNRALSQDEIRSLYRGKSITKGLVLYLPMNEYSGNKVYDHSGNQNHGVIHT